MNTARKIKLNPYPDATPVEKSTLSGALKKPGDLPSLPAILGEIQKIMNDPNTSGADLKVVVEKDPALTAAVLKLINSAFYAIPGGVSNLQRAIGFLGYDAVYQVALTVTLIRSFKITDFANFKLADFWRHSIAAATWAEEIAKHMKHARAADCFTTGLLHDLGKLFIAKEDPDALMRIVTQAYMEKKSFFEVENFHATMKHTHVGELLCNHWRLPRMIAFAMRWHHTEDISQRTGVSPEENQIVDIVMLANSLAHKGKFGGSGYPATGEISHVLLKRLLLNENLLKSIETKVMTKMEASEAFLSLLK